MRAGRLRHLVTLQALGTRVDDGAAGGSIPFVSYATNIPAAVIPLQGSELFQRAQFEATLTHRIEIRYRSDVKPSDRVLYGTRVFDIKSPPIDLEERHRETHLMCEELVTW